MDQALQPIKGCSFLSQRVFLHLVTGRKGDGGSGGGCRACSHIILAFHHMCPHLGLRHLSKTHCNASRNCASCSHCSLHFNLSIHSDASGRCFCWQAKGHSGLMACDGYIGGKTGFWVEIPFLIWTFCHQSRRSPLLYRASDLSWSLTLVIVLFSTAFNGN